MKHHIDVKNWIQAGVMLISVIVLAALAKHYEYPDIQVSHVEELVILGVEGEYEFLFLTDLHLAIKTREEAGPYGNAQERINAFSNVRGTVSAKQLPQWISYANKEKVDAVLMGGDILDYYSEENAAYLAGYLEQLEMPYVFTLGNHELFSPWEEEIPQDAVIYELFQDGTGAFQVLDCEEFVICAIDNEVYQVNEVSFTKNLQEDLARFTKMEEWILQNPKKPVILLAHVPFYTEKNQSLLLVFGFSFNDEHILEIVKRSLANPTLLVYIFCFTEDEANKIYKKFENCENFNNIKFIYDDQSNFDLEKLNKELDNIYS